MGLDMSHDAFHGAYSAFNRFREFICESTGGRWADIQHGDLTWEFGDGYTGETHPGLFALLSHSDCDGEIESDVAGKLADELESLLPKLEARNSGSVGHIAAAGGYVEVAKKMIIGCREAFSNGEPLTFG